MEGRRIESGEEIGKRNRKELEGKNFVSKVEGEIQSKGDGANNGCVKQKVNKVTLIMNFSLSNQLDKPSHVHQQCW